MTGDLVRKGKIKSAVKLLIKAALDPSGGMRLIVSGWGQIAPNALGSKQKFTVEVNFTPELPSTTSGLRIKPQTVTKHYTGWVSWEKAPKVSGELCDDHTTLKVENNKLIGAFPVCMSFTLHPTRVDIIRDTRILDKDYEREIPRIKICSHC